MTNTLDARQFQARLERLDALLHGEGRPADPAAQAHLQEIVRALLDLHGVALERLLEHVAAAGAAGRGILDACGQDDVVSGLLLLHGLHPHDLETRVRQALEGVRPLLRTHGGSVELLAVTGGVVRLRLDGNCHGCPSSAVTMQQTIEGAVYSKAPEVTAIEVEGLAESAPAPENVSARVALPLL